MKLDKKTYKVTVIDEDMFTQMTAGYGTLGTALSLADDMFMSTTNVDVATVEEVDSDGVTLLPVMKWNPTKREWDWAKPVEKQRLN